MILNKILKISATLTCETGLHIGGGDSEMHIGGIDTPVVKNPVTHEPYVPGSSLKGKIRSLMEWRSGMVKNEPLGIRDLNRAKGAQEESVLTILRLFGAHGADEPTEEQQQKIGPTRLSFWDCPISKSWLKSVEENNLLPVEAKSENIIDRISGKAQHPRQTERVPAGAGFDFTLTVKVLDTDNEDELVKAVFRGLKLLELDSLGGSGSRGYGKVKFTNLQVAGYSGKVQFDAVDPFGA
jgi:CRISPR-associated protein Csm3